MKPDNFLAAEAPLIARLKAVLPPEVNVLSAPDLDSIAASQQPTPAVHVLYLDYDPTDSSTASHAAVLQYWLTVVVTRNLADIGEGFHARQAGGPLAAKVMDALYRHTLKVDGKPLGNSPIRVAAAPRPGFLDGHSYLPLGWAVPINFSSDTCPT